MADQKCWKQNFLGWAFRSGETERDGTRNQRNGAKIKKRALGSHFEEGLTRMTLLLIFVLATIVQVQAQDTTSALNPQLEEHLQTAAQNNPGLEASFNRYLASLEEVPQVNALPDPELAFGYFISPIETRVGPQTARFSLSQMFPWFGTLGAREDIKINEARARFEEFQAHRNNLFYEVKSTWYELYVMNERIAILDGNIEILESLEELALQKVETAQSSQPDVLRVQIELEDLRIARSNLLDDRRVLRQEFGELLNSEQVAFPETMALSPLALPSGEQDLRRQMLEQNPGLNQLSFREQAAGHQVRAARLEGLPQFGVGFDYILTGQREVAMTDNGKDAFMARASIQIPLFRGKYRARKRQAELNQRSVAEQQAARQNELGTALEKALRDYRNANRRLNLYEEKQIKRTRQAIDILTEEYASADTEFEEILRLQRRLLDYQRSREEALGSQNRAVARIELLTGHYNIEPEETGFKNDSKKGN
ncbi:TolC family protein [Halalkalibaculum sp. DA384]|uniref:TolC family protein n=1 Tax=Halalkalibaculum sp. DA384 TaxID=3373606 RepID=UPI003754B8E5